MQTGKSAQFTISREQNNFEIEKYSTQKKDFVRHRESRLRTRKTRQMIPKTLVAWTVKRELED